jgi:hypothetical protein
VARETRAPVVEAAGGGEGGADLGHGEGSGDEPAEGHGGRAAEGEAGVVERGDGEDVEGDGEVGRHPAQVQFKQPTVTAMRREDEHRGRIEASLITHERWRLSSCLYPSSRRRAWSASPAGFPVMVRRGRAAPCRRGREDRGVGLLSLASCDAANKSRRQCPAWTLWWARASDAESKLEIRQWQSYLLIDES